MGSRKTDFQPALEESETVGAERHALPGSTKAALFAIGLFLVPLATFTLVQYLRYGFGLFLGWDTSTYVWWAELVYANGPLSLVLQGYPNLYILTLAGFGVLVQSPSMAERLLPFLVAIPLGYGYYRLTYEITFDKRMGYLGALVGGATINTLRLFSDLHRNLLSFGVSMLVGALISSDASGAAFSWQRRKKQVLFLWLPLLVVAAYTQIETYALLALSLTLYFFWTQKGRTAIVGMLLLATPILMALPLIWSFLFNYTPSLQLLGLPPPAAQTVLGDSLLYLGGLALPWTVIGLTDILGQARRGAQTAKFVVLWLLSGIALLPLGVFLGFPFDRFLFIVPVPVIIVSGVASTLRYGFSLARRGFLARFSLRVRTRFPKRSIVIPSTVALLLAAILITSVASDLFLRPYVSQADVGMVTEAGEIARQLGYSEPILVMYGHTAAFLNPIYRAYFGIQIPNNFAYYGKLQYLFTLPDPSLVYQWQFDPSFEQASSARYRAEILNQVRTPNSITSHAIVIAGGRSYERPFSELFIQRFQQAPGIYIIPPGQLTDGEIDSWRLFAYSDWTTVSQSSIVRGNWSLSGNVLNWVDREPNASFEAKYMVSLAKSWTTMNLSMRFLDWPQPLTFPDTSTVALAPLEVYFDNAPVFRLPYGSGAPATVNAQIPNVSSGVHTITVRSGSPGLAVAVALDYITLCPVSC